MPVEKVNALGKRDLRELTEASQVAIRDGSGFGWDEAPTRQVLERYWRGVLAVPTRTLFVARLDKAICGSIQLVAPPPNKAMWSFTAEIDTHFVVPWGRGHGCAKELVEAAEAEARAEGFRVLNLSVPATQSAAIKLYESLAYKRWGTLPRYARLKGEYVPGHYYTKDL